MFLLEGVKFTGSKSWWGRSLWNLHLWLPEMCRREESKRECNRNRVENVPLDHSQAERERKRNDLRQISRSICTLCPPSLPEDSSSPSISPFFPFHPDPQPTPFAPTLSAPRVWDGGKPTFIHHSFDSYFQINDLLSISENVLRTLSRQAVGRRRISWFVAHHRTVVWSHGSVYVSACNVCVCVCFLT